MRIKGLAASVVGVIAVVAATVTGTPAAEAGKCHIECPNNSCSVKSLLRRVYCYCSDDGWAHCGTGHQFSKFTLVKYYASEEQLSSLEEYIVRAYDLGLYSVGNGASAMYEGIVMGNVKLYDQGLDDFTIALDAINDADRALLDASEDEE